MIQEVSSLYIHFPICKHVCNYCDFYKFLLKDKTSQFSNFHHYLSLSMAELKKLSAEENFTFSSLETLYIGGGTPSIWGVEGAHFLRDFFKKNELSFKEKYEFTLEVNPGQWTVESLHEWENIGVNRYSIGVQTLNSNFLQLLDRVHTIEDTFQTLEYFASRNVNYSVDLMIGLPYSEENKRDIMSEIEKILKYRPNHFSVYILTAKGAYPLKNFLPEDDFLRCEYLAVVEFLKASGYIQYEVSNFSKENFESLHNLKYWNYESVLALGQSATGLFVKNHQTALRYKWKSTLPPNFEVEKLSSKEVLLERLYLALRTNKGIHPEDYFSEEERGKLQILQNLWLERGYLLSNVNSIKLTTLGFLMLDSVMDDLFRELKFP